MCHPWEIYDALIDDLPADVTVTAAHHGPRWTRVFSSACAQPEADVGMGTAWTMPVTSRPALAGGTPPEGRPLRDVAALMRSWNLEEASLGLAALNSWYSRAETAAFHGFEPTGAGLTWGQVFDPYRDLVSGRTVAIVGHFPFARAALVTAAEVQILERNLRPDDYPDTACEYLLPEADYVFISSSSLVNKTAPRLVALAADGGASSWGRPHPCTPCGSTWAWRPSRDGCPTPRCAPTGPSSCRPTAASAPAPACTWAWPPAAPTRHSSEPGSAAMDAAIWSVRHTCAAIPAGRSRFRARISCWRRRAHRAWIGRWAPLIDEAGVPRPIR